MARHPPGLLGAAAATTKAKSAAKSKGALGPKSLLRSLPQQWLQEKHHQSRFGQSMETEIPKQPDDGQRGGVSPVVLSWLPLESFKALRALVGANSLFNHLSCRGFGFSQLPVCGDSWTVLWKKRRFLKEVTCHGWVIGYFSRPAKPRWRVFGATKVVSQ